MARINRIGSLVKLHSGRQGIVTGEHDYHHFNESGLAIIPRVKVRMIDDGVEFTIPCSNVKFINTVYNGGKR